jgi:hypothetical protein
MNLTITQKSAKSSNLSISIDRPVLCPGREILGHLLFPVFGDYCQVDLFSLTYPEADKILLFKFGSKSEFVGGFYV